MQIATSKAATKVRIQEIERESDAKHEAWMASTNATRNPLQYNEIETTSNRKHNRTMHEQQQTHQVR